MDSLDTLFFVGRDTFLPALHTTLLDHQMVVIAGKSGIGKTATLQEYIRRYSHNYQSIIWLNAATDETFLAALITALQSYALPIDINQGTAHLFQTLHTYMSEHPQALLILDNFSYTFTVQRLSDPQPPIHIAIITQEQKTPPEIPRLELTALDQHDGAVLLLRQAGLLSPQQPLDQADGEQRQHALKLASELHGFPLALQLVGRYIQMTGNNVQDESARDIFSVVCEQSLTYINEADPTALERLQIAALLLPEAIPDALFLSQAGQATPRNGGEQQPHIRQIVLDTGLLADDQQTHRLSMHRLVQDTVRQTLTAEQQQQYIEQALLLLHPYLPTLQTASLSTRLLIAGQIRHLANISESESAFSDTLKSVNEAADVFAWAASLFWEQQLIGLAEPLLRRAFTIRQHTLGNAHPTVATILSNLAMMNGRLKNYAEAEAFAHQAIVSKSNASGIDHPDVLLALNQLGHLYTEQGKLKEARQCYEKALTIGETVKLQRHPVYSTVMYDLALLYIEQQNWGQADTLLRKVCIARTSALGAKDPATVEAWFSLAKVSIKQKNWQWANMAYQRALPIYKILFGEEHPTTLDHQEKAASVLLQLGKIAEAKQQLQRIYEIRERTQGKEHTAIVPCLNGLAQIALAQEEYTAAQSFLMQAQHICANQSESDPLMQATVLDTLAAVELVQHHIEEATATCTQALDLRIQILGQKHLDLIEPLNHLATVYIQQKEYPQARSYLLQAISIYQEAQRPEDIALDPALNELANIEIEYEHYEMARSYLERSRAIRELALGANDPRTTETIQKIASLTTTLA